MKLVETDIEIEREREESRAETSTPPRPEHRKAYVSLLVTGAVLVGTVALVYVLFPKRDHEVIATVIEKHRAPGAFAMDRPNRDQLIGWTIGVMSRSVPWPDTAGLTIEGVKKLSMLKKPAAMVRYRVGADVVTLVGMQTWDAVPNVIELDAGDLRAVWWRRKGPWTMIAVGPAATAASWRQAIGAPK